MKVVSNGYTRDVDPDLAGYQMLVAFILREAVREYCTAAVGHGPAWAYARLAHDAGCAYWAEALGIQWPPQYNVIAEIVAALQRGEAVWRGPVLDL